MEITILGYLYIISTMIHSKFQLLLFLSFFSPSFIKKNSQGTTTIRGDIEDMGSTN